MTNASNPTGPDDGANRQDTEKVAAAKALLDEALDCNERAEKLVNRVDELCAAVKAELAAAQSEGSTAEAEA